MSNASLQIAGILVVNVPIFMIGGYGSVRFLSLRDSVYLENRGIRRSRSRGAPTSSASPISGVSGSGGFGYPVRDETVVMAALPLMVRHWDDSVSAKDAHFNSPTLIRASAHIRAHM